MFYDLLAGQRAEFELGSEPGAYWYLRQSGTYVVSGRNDADEFATLCEAQEKIGIDATQMQSVLSLVAGVLHLGNVEFDGDDAASVSFSSQGALGRARRMLGMEGLQKCLTARSVRANGEVISVKLTPEKAAFARDALAKASYTALFEWVVERINQGMMATGQTSGFLGMLDVFGFESFQSNSFEQLCINFANEKLQHFFLRFVFVHEEMVYAEEGVAWARIEYQDNQGCIDLIEKSPSGILRLLDEACKKPNATDQQLCESLASLHRCADFFLDAKARGLIYE